ncbi:hypothetical protein EV359DRAFT_82036 [Lentinula novae-zelandiae]|nr:hypothetical protein EV359DRAFT_82036 [Lentinula novae-zelandiae]
MSQNASNSSKEPLPGQQKLGFHLTQPVRNQTTPASPAVSTNGDDDQRTLIAKAITMKLMASDEDCTVVLPVKLMKLATAVKDGKTKITQGDMWEKVTLIGKILQECSFHDQMKHFRDELIEKMEEWFDDKTCRLEGRVKIMRKEVEDASKATEKLKEKMEELVKDLEARGNAAREGMMESEDAAQAKSVAQHIQQPRHSPAIRDAEMRNRRIIIKLDVESDWKLMEKEIVTKANLTMDKMLDDEGVGSKMKVMAATKIEVMAPSSSWAQ